VFDGDCIGVQFPISKTDQTDGEGGNDILMHFFSSPHDPFKDIFFRTWYLFYVSRRWSVVLFVFKQTWNQMQQDHFEHHTYIICVLYNDDIL
jgi:hypothetical protein